MNYSINRVSARYLIKPAQVLMLGIAMTALTANMNQSRGLIGFPQQVKEKGQLRFRLTLASSGKTTQGSRFSHEVYEATDGISVSLRLDRFRSVGAARQELKKTVRTGTVIERVPKLDQAGRQVGERVVIKFISGRSRVRRAAVVWTEGRELRRIESSSLSHVLEFEREFYP